MATVFNPNRLADEIKNGIARELSVSPRDADPTNLRAD